VDAVVAKTFARLFYRNAINSALAAIECPEVVDAVFEQTAEQGSRLTGLEMKINFSEGKIFLSSKEYSFPPWNEQAMLIFNSGGLAEYTRQRLQTR
jgi:3-isopropylmalate/(R)-2-methylmalate dehydratase small subunit